jgi:SAM-dependent methyltransferase
MTEVRTLSDIVNRIVPPAPWAEGDNIPWNEPGFSARMLREHLSQDHDLASRRAALIDRHVDWIHHTLLGGHPTRILDLGCGPGLYTSRLARRGHACVGIDFSPASIAHAGDEASRDGLACTYVEADAREADFGCDFGLVMMIFGQINVFRREAMRDILRRSHAALRDGGQLLLEPQRDDHLRKTGTQPASWSSHEAGLFSDQPHLVLREPSWDEDATTCTERFYVIDAATGCVTRYALSSVGCTLDELTGVLADSGFRDVTSYPSLVGVADESAAHSYVIVAQQ